MEDSKEFRVPNGYLIRSKRRNRTRKDLGIKNKGGLFDLFDNAIKEIYRITDDEYDYLADSFSDEEIGLFIKEDQSFSEAKKCLSMVETRLLEYYTKKEIEEEKLEKFTKNDWDHMHDCVLHATWNTSKKKSTREELIDLFKILPEDLKEEAYNWGMSDTPWREKFIDWYEKNIL